MRLAFCLYWWDWGIISASLSHTADNPPSLNWHTPILLAALHSGSFGFPQQLDSVDLRLKIRQIILWCSRLVWESLPSSKVVHFCCTEQSFWRRLLWFPSLSWIIQNSSMERHSDCASYVFKDEDRRMAGVQARKEEEKKRESHKQTIHKVQVWTVLLLSSLSVLVLGFKCTGNKQADISYSRLASVLWTQGCPLSYILLS